MKFCCVPGCTSKSGDKSKKRTFHYLPKERSNGVLDKSRKKRRQAWIKALHATKLPKKTLDNITVCSEHFVLGRPASHKSFHHLDWIPTRNMPQKVFDKRMQKSVEKIIKNLPEVLTQYDFPEYISLNKLYFNEKEIELKLLQEYITVPICDENGYYSCDHDYLGLPVLPIQTETPQGNPNEEHSYSFPNRPACLRFDSRHFCNICVRNCIDLFSFNKHMAEHTLRNDVLCGICYHKFLTSNCLNNHLEKHRAVCKICGNEIPLVQLKAHEWVNTQQKHQNEDIKRYKIPDKMKIYFCVSCMKSCASARQYLEHVCQHQRKKL